MKRLDFPLLLLSKENPGSATPYPGPLVANHSQKHLKMLFAKKYGVKPYHITLRSNMPNVLKL